MPIQKFTSNVTMQIQPLTASAAGTAGQPAYTLSRLLGTGSTLSLITGTNSNLTLSGLNIVPTAAIGLTTQTAEVREVLGQVAVEYPVSITGTVAAAGALTTMPVATALYTLDPDQISGADGSRVTSYTDQGSGLVATANNPTNPIGPVLKTNAYNGHKALRFAAVVGEHLSIGRPAALQKTTAYTVVVTVANVTSNAQFACAMGSDQGTSGYFAAACNNYSAVGMDNYRFTGDGPLGVQTLVYSGDTGAGTQGRLYRNGHQTQAGVKTLGQGALDILIGNWKKASDGTFNGPFGGDILSVEIFDRAFTPPEVLQTHFAKLTKFGEALPIVGRTYFPVFVGDSQTYGTGLAASTDVPYLSYPSQIATKRGWKLSQFVNIGVPSIDVNSTGGLRDRAAAEVDPYATVTGLPVVVIFGEWHNQGVVGGTMAGGVTTADNNRLYATQRKAAGKITKIIGWTSHDSTREGLQRDGFNQSLVNTPGDFDYMIPVHTNAQIGLDGTVSGSTTYSTDNIHLKATGYAILRDLIDAGMISAGYST